MITRVKRNVLGGIALAAVAVLVAPGAAFAGSPNGTATLTGGTLDLAAPATVAFTATLDGTDKFAAADQSITVKDHTGNAAGWALTLSATQFLNDDGVAEHALPANAVSDYSNDGGACAVGAAGCTLADNIAGQAPVTVNDTGVVIMNASADKGMGDQTWVNTMHLAIPANARAGSYSSTWVYTIAPAV